MCTNRSFGAMQRVEPSERSFDALQDVGLMLEGDDVVHSNSVILAVASPVFVAMLSSCMVEGSTKKVSWFRKANKPMKLFCKFYVVKDSCK